MRTFTSKIIKMIQNIKIIALFYMINDFTKYMPIKPSYISKCNTNTIT